MQLCLLSLSLAAWLQWSVCPSPWLHGNGPSPTFAYGLEDHAEAPLGDLPRDIEVLLRASDSATTTRVSVGKVLMRAILSVANVKPRTSRTML